MHLAPIKNDQRGVTLLELMIVLALLAGVCAVGLPLFLDHVLPSHRLKNAAQQLVCDMYQAKMLAAGANRQFRIVFDIPRNAYRLESGDRASQSDTWSRVAIDRGCGEVMLSASFPGVRILTATRPHIVFHPTGEQTAMRISLSGEALTTITILSSMTGRIRMERGGS